MAKKKDPRQSYQALFWQGLSEVRKVLVIQQHKEGKKVAPAYSWVGKDPTGRNRWLYRAALKEEGLEDSGGGLLRVGSIRREPNNLRGRQQNCARWAAWASIKLYGKKKINRFRMASWAGKEQEGRGPQEGRLPIPRERGKK